MPALRRHRARVCVPRVAARAILLQLLEISTPRRCPTKVFLIRQATSPLQALHRAYTSEARESSRTKCVLKSIPRRCHRVAHRAAHRWKPCEVCGIVEILRSENVRDDEVVGKAGVGFLRGGLLRIGSGRRAHSSERALNSVTE